MWNEPIIRVLDVVTGDERVRLKGHRAWISAVVLWPDGKRLASASADQTINVSDLADPAHPKLEGQCLLRNVKTQRQFVPDLHLETVDDAAVTGLGRRSDPASTGWWAP